MKITDAINQLESLKEHCKDMAKSDPDVWEDDVRALEAGIFALEMAKGQGYTTIGKASGGRHT